MKITGTKTLNLIPIGNVKFSFTREKNKVYIGELNIMCETDINITVEQEKELLKLMKQEKSDLLTDGTSFFTTRGPRITQISHQSFNQWLEIEKEKIFKHRFG